MDSLGGISKSSLDDVWRQLSHDMGGYFVGSEFSNSGNPRRVVVKVKNWTLTLDTFIQAKTDTYTRMRTRYVTKDGFQFTVYRKGIFSELGKMLGMQDIEVGFPDLDRDFIIKGNNESQLHALFGNARIRELIQYQPAIHLQANGEKDWFGNSLPQGVNELFFRATEEIDDLERLKSLFELFSETLGHLCHIGSANEDDPSSG